jgi:hypothetical protein
VFFEDLLTLEDDEILWNYRTSDGIPLWLEIRWAIFWNLQRHKYRLSNPHQREILTLLDYMKFIINAFIKNPFRSGKDKVLIFSLSANYVREDNKFIDRLYDPYILGNDKFQIITSNSKIKILDPILNKCSISSDLFRIFIFLFSRIIGVRKKDKKTIEAFVKYLIEKRIVKVGDRDNVIKYVTKNKKKNRVKRIIYKEYYKKKQPKAIIIQCAHYGDYCVEIMIAKRYRIPVIEMQHGFIGKGHLAYNYNYKSYDIIRDYLPDYIFTFGNYWNNNIRSPAKKIAIGYCYLEKYSQNNNHNQSKIILLVSGGTMPLSYIKIAKELKDILGGIYKLEFRPHPSEIPKAADRYHEIADMGYRIDKENLYQTLNKASIVVSLELSTVLFEALMFTNNVYLIKNQAVEQILLDELYPFKIVESVYEIYEKEGTIQNNKTYDQLWRKNAKQNFISAIAKIAELR